MADTSYLTFIEQTLHYFNRAQGVVASHKPLHLIHAGTVVLMNPPANIPRGQF